MNNIEIKINDYRKHKYNDAIEKFNIVEKERIEFIENFSIDKIGSMKLDDYVSGNGKNKDTFCYSLETKLKELGSISGSTAIKFGVFYSNKLNKYVVAKKWDENQDAETAFAKIKSAIIDLLKAGKERDIDKITKNSLSEMFKSKILSTYFPDHYLNVFSSSHVDYFVYACGIGINPKCSTEQKRQSLIEFKKNCEFTKDFNNYTFMSFLYYWIDPNSKEMRILHLSKNDFLNADYEQVQHDFILNQLANQNHGEYLYIKSQMEAGKDALVLFEYNNMIVASARLKAIKKFKKERSDNYTGAYYFYENSIQIIEPILLGEINIIDFSFNLFSKSKSKIDITKYNKVIDLLSAKTINKLPEEVNKNTMIEGGCKSILINAYERSPKARLECIKYYGAKCIVCGFSFEDKYGPIVSGKIHVHHLKPISEVNEMYVVDPINDLVPVCPNCHLVMHSKQNGSYTVEEVKKMMKIA